MVLNGGMDTKVYTLQEAADILGWDYERLKTMKRRKKLSTVDIPYGQARFRAGITSETLSLLQNEQVEDQYEKLFRQWQNEMRTGKNRRSPVKETTIERYNYGLVAFWDSLHGKKPKDKGRLDTWRNSQKRTMCRFTLDNIAHAIASVDKEKAATRFNMYETTRVFYQFLIDQGLRPETDLLRFSKFKPEKNKRPRRTHVKDQSVFEELVTANLAWYSGRSKYDRLLTDVLLKTLWYTGARNNELCTLTRRAVDFRDQVMLLVGKGDKERSIGIHPDLLEILKAYEIKRPSCNHRYFFAQENGAPLNRRIISERIGDVAEKIGIDLTPHGLRRTFITRYLLAGAPTTQVQRIVGHERLETTNLYNMSDANDALDLLRKSPSAKPKASIDDDEDGDNWDF